ncbi:MAG TPA: DUF1761 domain-containing protein [Anaerolineales bacterium]
MLSFDVNWIAVIVAVIANMVIGAAWFAVFANPWMQGVGKTRQEIEGDQDWRPYAVAVLNSFLMAFVLANVIAWSGATGLLGGLVTGLIMWLGFTGFTFAVNHAFEGRSLTLWAINSGTYLVGLLVMGMILGVWR